MNSLRITLFLAFFVLICGCKEENITNQYQSNLGNIKGRVIAEDNVGNIIPLENAAVIMPGTSVKVYTDSSGNFLIMNLPADTYNLEINYYGVFEYIYNISVNSDNTTTIPDILLDYHYATDPTFLSSVSIRNNSASNSLKPSTRSIRPIECCFCEI